MDTNKLRYFIADRGKTLVSYEQALGISKSALYRKMQGQTEFTRDEIEKTIRFLCLSEAETISIFLTTWFLKRNFDAPKGELNPAKPKDPLPDGRGREGGVMRGCR